MWQCIAMVPGVSRSAATIIGGMQQGLTRKLAAEFSFFVAVPTMAAATGYKLLKGYESFTSEHIKLLAIGNMVAFIVAIIAIKFFIGFLQKYGFRVFGWYRIIAGILLILMEGFDLLTRDAYQSNRKYPIFGFNHKHANCFKESYQWLGNVRLG